MVATDLGKKVNRFSQLMEHVEDFVVKDLLLIGRFLTWQQPKCSSSWRWRSRRKRTRPKRKIRCPDYQPTSQADRTLQTLTRRLPWGGFFMPSSLSAVNLARLKWLDKVYLPPGKEEPFDAVHIAYTNLDMRFCMQTRAFKSRAPFCKRAPGWIEYFKVWKALFLHVGLRLN